MDNDDSTLYEASVSMTSRCDTPTDDFEVIDDEVGQDLLSLNIQPLASQDAMLVSIIPPRQPRPGLKHVPCDIVLVIDVSGSMKWSAPLPDVQHKATKESSGLSILDLTKHAARTIVETLNEGDRLGIVTFSTDARVEQRLLPMTVTTKKETVHRIERLVDQSSTNLWAGIKAGLNMFTTTDFIGNVQGLFVLTDGMPNHMCPPQGYMTKLKPMLADMALRNPCVPTIHTFGFGYDILSGLLQGIAEVGHGNYAFIPDAGMIGTVFVHAVANLYSTYAIAAEVEVTTSDDRALLECEMGLPTTSVNSNTISVKLGNIQYGQSRDITIMCRRAKLGAKSAARITYKLPNGSSQVLSCTTSPSEKSTVLSPAMTAYHLHRAQLCRFLSNICPPQDKSSSLTTPLRPGAQTNAVSLYKLIEANLSVHSYDPNIKSLLQDLLGDTPGGVTSGAIPTGQIYQALLDTQTHRYYSRWGAHYLPSLLHAHRRQICNSFKDPGPLRYGADSPLFTSCRDELDAAFDNLPAPKPSISTYVTKDHLGRSVTRHTVALSSLSRYNRYDNPCFLGSCHVKIVTSDGMQSKIPVQGLQAGMSVYNPITHETRSVIAVVKTGTQPGSMQKICRVRSNSPDNADDEASDLWITEHHPILHHGAWRFPHDVTDETRPLTAGEAVYSILLSESSNPDAHAVEIEGVACVTLGHGLVAPPSDGSFDVRVHSFFGDYDAVYRSIARLPRQSVNDPMDPNTTVGHRVCIGVGRDSETGLANGFVAQLREQQNLVGYTDGYKCIMTAEELTATSVRQGAMLTVGGES